MVERISRCMIEAEKNIQPVRIGVGFTNLYNTTRNRRAGISPYVRPDTIDPEMGVIRIDDLNGKPLATL